MKRTRNKVTQSKWSWGILLIFGLMIVPMFVQARELSESEVRPAVETWVRYVTADARPSAVVDRMEYHRVDGKTVAYIAHLWGGGFCLCGADDLVLPVYLYNPHGDFDPHIPDYQHVLWEISTRLKTLREGLAKGDPTVLQYQDLLSERAFLWQNLIAGQVPQRWEKPEDTRAAPDSMELIFTPQWHQGSPYNDLCPELDPGNNTEVPVGCVATAMAQIMYHWKWPNTGVGADTVFYNRRWETNWISEPLATDPGIPGNFAGRLQWTTTGGGQLEMNGRWDISVYWRALEISSDTDYQTALTNLYNRLNSNTTTCPANFGASSYNWSVLKDSVGEPPDPGASEAAEISYQAGVAVDMTYGTWGSLASTSEVPGALADHFRYDPDGVYDPMSTRSATTMVDEIQWLRPVEMRGVRPLGGGHAWVCYGYNKNLSPWQFLMNMGWGPATSHVWYSLDDVNLQFILHQYHATRLAPLNVVGFVGASDPGDGSPDDPYQDIEEAIVEAPDNSTLIFKAGSNNAFSAATLTIDRPLTLTGRDVTISKSGSRSSPRDIDVEKVDRETEDVLKEGIRPFEEP